MKKILSLLLVFLMLFTFSGCSQKDIEQSLDIAIAVMEQLDQNNPQPDLSSAESLEEIPEFSEDAWVAVNNNIPFFVEEEYTTESYEFYSDLDESMF